MGSHAAAAAHLGGHAPSAAVPDDGESAAACQRGGDLRRLGETLNCRTDHVVSAMMLRTAESGRLLDPDVEERFERVGAVSTIAVARWMAGEGAEVARMVGQESWSIFGQLAAQRAAPVSEVTKRCLRWWNAAEDVLRELCEELGICPEARSEALAMLQRSLSVTLVRMCETFDAERHGADEQLARRQQELSFMATHDALTGLPNRTLILDRLQQMLVRGRHTKSPVAVLFIDLDNFKTINDTLGHAAGDELLQSVARRLDAVVRDVDALGRLAGDEFVVLAGEISVQAGPELIAQRLVAALKRPFPLGDEQTPVTVTASVGIAAGSDITADDLLRDADIAMYRAKWDGKNRFVVFESGMQDTLAARMQLEMDLRAALANDEFFLAYQPTFNLSDMSTSGVEALIRWSSPTRGLVQPDDFIPVLEETGLIVDVGRWVLHCACAQGALWRAAGHQVGVAVNVSGPQLDSDLIVGDVQAALSASGLVPGGLTIEITETTLMRNVDETAARLLALKELGVRVAIDDFGTGYSSLAHLRQFPVDALKIDRSFIAGLAHSKEGESLMRTLVQLGRDLSIETIAEGIERPGELSLLREEECDGGQGFLFARPLDASAVEAFLRERAAGGVPPLSRRD
jgi:diguanylate cyclase (GGDEF)-like protein